MYLVNEVGFQTNVPVIVSTGNHAFRELNMKRFSNIGELADALEQIEHHVDPVIGMHVIAGLRKPFNTRGLSIIGNSDNGYSIAQTVGDGAYITVASLQLLG